MHYMPGLRLRVSDRIELIGIDESEMGEFGYDYVGPQLDTRSIAPSHTTGFELQRSELKDRMATII